MSVRIEALEVENVKRVKALAMEPSPSGLTVVGGRNNQGKTSVLDAIAWALGGDRMKPSNPKREGAAGDPRLKVVLNNGIVVERKGRNGSLKVTDPSGEKGGQALLNGFVEQLALDLPRFMGASSREKADVLLQLIGVGDQLAELERREQSLYNQRTTVGQMAKQKRGAAEELPFHADAPAEPVSAAELVQEQQGILARNGENQKKREQVSALEGALQVGREEKNTLQARIEDLERQLAEAREKSANVDAALERTKADLETARKTAEQLRDESTAEIEASLAEVDATNAKVRENQARAAAEAEADELEAQYADMTAQVEGVRAEKRALLDGADLPLPGLSVEGGELVYEGQPWDGMSGSEQLRVATAIVRALKPECGFVLLDKTEQMDLQTLSEFGEWAEREGLQVICTRVSTGDECSIVIEDGRAAGKLPAEPEQSEETDAAQGVPAFNFPGKEM